MITTARTVATLGRTAVRAAAIAAEWPRDDETFTPLGGDIAASRDLAYTYGTLRTAQAAGHYVHLWTREPSGFSWRLAAVLRLR